MIPRANPDAAEARFRTPLFEAHATGAGVDDDRDGRARAKASTPNTLQVPRPGWAEHDADEHDEQLEQLLVGSVDDHRGDHPVHRDVAADPFRAQVVAQVRPPGRPGRTGTAPPTEHLNR